MSRVKVLPFSESIDNACFPTSPPTPLQKKRHTDVEKRIMLGPSLKPQVCMYMGERKEEKKKPRASALLGERGGKKKFCMHQMMDICFFYFTNSLFYEQIEKREIRKKERDS